MKICNTKFVVTCILMLLVLMINVSSAATIEIVSGKLPVKVEEKKQVDFSIKIKDYKDSKQLMLETSLIPYENKPIWDFGGLNSIVDGNINRYQQKIILNLSSLPAILDISVSGKAPDGETRVKCSASDLVFSKLSDTKLKFYEARIDEKLAGIESFELIIEKKKIFDDTIEQIGQKEFGGIIREDRKLFDNGLTIEAQNIANELKNIRWPNSLSLLGIIKIDSDIWLNIITMVILVIGLLIGFLIGVNIDNSDKED